jgi:hypothetical protein
LATYFLALAALGRYYYRVTANYRILYLFEKRKQYAIKKIKLRGGGYGLGQ